jgi:ornithine decarboxylase
MDRFTDALDAVRRLRPEGPLAIRRPERVRVAGRWFVENFAGDVLYAAKANPEPWVLNALWETGVRMFDVASEVECRLVRDLLPEATLAFMHPVKSRRAIATAYREMGCRIFALDTMDELHKILDETGHARDLTLVIRLAVSNADASLPLAAKFGAAGEEAVALMRAARAATEEDLGLSFHVGSQCMKPAAYRAALMQARALIVAAGVTVDVIDVGGGFPSIYPGMNPPPMIDFVREIERVFEDMPVTMNCKLWAEPGRALVAEAGSIVARVELRKGDALYLNDGAYGNLFDATHVQWAYPLQHIRPDDAASCEGLKPFRFYGPTCDSIDAAEGPFMLPGDIREGDFIEIGMLGAYGTAMATRFNGFGETVDAICTDAPWPSMYGHAPVAAPASLRR